MTDRAYLSYLRTLRRVPKPIILSMATREMHMQLGDMCLCGWAIKEAFANGLRAEEVDPYHPETLWDSPYLHCRKRFGGTYAEWLALYNDAIRNTPVVEEAFTRRVMECVR